MGPVGGAHRSHSHPVCPTFAQLSGDVCGRICTRVCHRGGGQFCGCGSGWRCTPWCRCTHTVVHAMVTQRTLVLLRALPCEALVFHACTALHVVPVVLHVGLRGCAPPRLSPRATVHTCAIARPRVLPHPCEVTSPCPSTPSCNCTLLCPSTLTCNHTSLCPSTPSCICTPVSFHIHVQLHIPMSIHTLVQLHTPLSFHTVVQSHTPYHRSTCSSAHVALSPCTPLHTQQPSPLLLPLHVPVPLHAPLHARRLRPSPPIAVATVAVVTASVPPRAVGRRCHGDPSP